MVLEKSKNADLTEMLTSLSQNAKAEQKAEEKAFRDLRDLSVRYEDMVRLHNEVLRAVEDTELLNVILRDKLPAMKAAILKQYNDWKKAKETTIFSSPSFDAVSKICEYALGVIEELEKLVTAMKKERNKITEYHNEANKRLPELILDISNSRIELDIMRKSKGVLESLELAEEIIQ